MSSSPILEFPKEIVEHTLTFCHPFDVAAFARSCRSARDLVYYNFDSHLWRQLFLLYPFDDPRKSLKATDDPDFTANFDWKRELQRRVIAERITPSSTEHALKSALDTFISVVQEASPFLSGHELEPCHNVDWLTRVLRDSRLLDTAPCSIDPAEEQLLQLLARLKSCLGLSIGQESNTHLNKQRSASRCYVYDLRNYRFDNNWGPFLDGGGVNWRHIEAILNVILMNLCELPDGWLQVVARPPVGFHATRAYSAPDCLMRNPRDWAGVEGIWRRYVCFMDYRDLFAFNYSNTSDPRNQSFFESQSFREATRLMELELQIIPLEAMQLRNRIPPEVYLARDKNLPCLYPPLCFSGFSRGLIARPAVVEGTVNMGCDGIVRWQFTSIYDGRTQWCSEGVQVANVASAVGVVGSWTGVHHSPGDPVGPFWMWRVQQDDSTAH